MIFDQIQSQTISAGIILFLSKKHVKVGIKIILQVIFQVQY